MKNFIPLILAVLLGLAAVLAVGRLLSQQKQTAEKTVTVVAAARDIAQGEVVSKSYIMERVIPEKAVPQQAIYWSRADMVVGQKALRPIPQNDYVLLADVGLSGSMGNIIGEGEWAVALNLGGNTGIARMVQAGDEVAVIGTFKIQSKVKSADLSAPEQVVKKDATIVLFPRVRVLDVGGLRMGRGEGGGEEGGGTIILALPPSQAQMLIASQRQGDLTLAMRRPGDASNLNRLDAGMIDDQTFNALLDGLQSFKVPKIPTAPEK